MTFRGFVKYIIYSVNLVFTLIGLAIIALGTAAHFKFTEIAEAQPILSEIENFQYLPYVVIVFGVIIFLVSFSGCCGTSTQIKWLLITYTVFLSILAVLKLAAAVLLLITNFRKLIEASLTDAFKQNDGVFQVVEAIFECCGTNGPDSYDNSADLVPYTCCKGHTGKESLTCFKDDAFTNGCLSTVGEKVAVVIRNIAIALIVLMGFELAALGITIYLIITLKTKKKPDESIHHATNAKSVQPVNLY